MKPLAATAWEKGPTGGLSSGEVIAILLMENSRRVSYMVRMAATCILIKAFARLRDRF
jgi:hypothetical protein